MPPLHHIIHLPFPLPVAGLAVVVVTLQILWRNWRKRQVIEAWAARNGYWLLEWREPWIGRGPFFFWSGKGQAVLRIRVETPEGEIRSGWARCGSWFLGLLSDEVEVRWDGTKAEPRGFPVIIPGADEKD